MDIVLKIGIAGWLILVTQLAVFSLLLILGLRLEKSSRVLRACLSRCLRESRDLVAEGDAGLEIARACATRYRLAAARIESVDAYAICSSEVSRASAGLFIGKKWSYSKVDELLHGGAGFLVTLGLIGTFVGLMGNMVQLSELVLASEEASQQSTLLAGLAAVFPSMAAAFSTSLLGVSLSSALWLVGTSNGMLNLKNEITELLTGYIEQVVQADCRRYSLVGESIERMEQYLTDYLSQFSTKVSKAIEEAISSNIGNLVAALANQVMETKDLVAQVRQGSEKLVDAGQVFWKASSTLKETDFAERFGNSCESFLESSNVINESSKLLFRVATASSESSKLLAGSVTSANEVLQGLSSSLEVTDKRAKDVIALAYQSNERLAAATSAVEGIQKRGMTWLGMRAKTDQQLIEINGQLNSVIAGVTDITNRVADTRIRDIDDITEVINRLNEGIAELEASVRSQSGDMLIVLEGLRQMQAVVNRLKEEAKDE
jgi:hypothetical protein